MNQWIHVYVYLPARAEQVKLSDKSTARKGEELEKSGAGSSPKLAEKLSSTKSTARKGEELEKSSAGSSPKSAEKLSATKSTARKGEELEKPSNGSSLKLAEKLTPEDSEVNKLEQVSLVQIVQNYIEENVAVIEHKWATEGENYLSVEFYCLYSQVEELVDFFVNAGIGKLFNSYYRISSCLFYQSAKLKYGDVESGEDPKKIDRRRSDFLETMKSRITVQQVVEGSRSGGTITFDYAIFLLCAGILAATGLVENSSVVLVASMLVSPIMGPILAGTFGLSIRDKSLYRLGIINELISLACCLFIGFCYGLVYSSIYSWHEGEFITEEMKSRGQTRSLFIGLLVALPSGVGVALSVLGNNVGSLVGVAISASLLPPMVNAGILFSLSFVRTIAGDTTLPPKYESVYSDSIAEESAILALFSICLTLLNILCIVVMGLVVLKIKQVVPRANNTLLKKFFEKDLVSVRNWNARNRQDAHDWQNDPYMTTIGLEGLFNDIQDDPVYKTICASAYRNPHGNLSPAPMEPNRSSFPFSFPNSAGSTRRSYDLHWLTGARQKDDPMAIENEDEVTLRSKPQSPPGSAGSGLKKLFARRDTVSDMFHNRKSDVYQNKKPNQKFRVTRIAEEEVILNPV